MTLTTKSPTWQELRPFLADSGLFSSLDIHFADFAARLAETETPAIPLAAALVSRKTSEGNICLDLAEFASKALPTDTIVNDHDRYVCPALSDWIEQLLGSGVAGDGSINIPLVIDPKGRLYLHRYWEYEKSVVNFMKQRAPSVIEDIDYVRLKTDVQKLFRPQSPGKTDWQKIGAITAVTRSFTVISGGPGTGKTSTVARILALLYSQYERKKNPRILLAAPTGKAASRLQEAIGAANLLPGKVEIPQATTLHRMLGTIPGSPYFRYNRNTPLEADIIIIDEASMVDLPLMAKLMQAVPDSARLVLLGDRHQLASVQPGSVLGDICRTESLHQFSDPFRRLIEEISGKDSFPETERISQSSCPELEDSFVELVANYRFPDESAIARLSRAVKTGDSDKAVALLSADKNSRVLWSDIPAKAEVEEKLHSWDGFAAYASLLRAEDADACFAVLDNFRILCALRKGPYGMEWINSLLARRLAVESRKTSSQSESSLRVTAPPILPGQPVMITKNDYNLKLFNGDVGVTMPAPGRNNPFRIFFKKEDGNMRDIGQAMLPEHETVFAMTVHKSQGSEFDRVLIILPDLDSPLLTRELLYTAITRAREKVEIWGRKEIFHAAVKRRIKRTSGLTDKLWEAGG